MISIDQIVLLLIFKKPAVNIVVVIGFITVALLAIVYLYFALSVIFVYFI